MSFRVFVDRVNEAPELELERDDSSLIDQIPFNGFFGDDFLTLIYLSPPDAPIFHDAMRETLHVLADEKQSNHCRAQAAVQVGRFVEHNAPAAPAQLGRSESLAWFELAQQLGSIVGVWELANEMLKQCDLKVSIDLNTNPLPELRARKDNARFRIDVRVAQAWYEGIRLTLTASQNNFEHWDLQAHQCAVSCIVNYLLLLPDEPPRSLRKYNGDEPLIVKRFKTLQWFAPFWDRLIESMSNDISDGVKQLLIEQKYIVSSYIPQLVQQCTDTQPGSFDDRNMPQASHQVQTNAVDQLVVIKGQIPASSDRDDVLVLKQYASLQKPVRFKTFPALEQLLRMREQLFGEFPWAQDAIRVVMNDLIARRRHGVTRLGMAPVLLVGKPGTGKTRFAQRLSALLETPSSVINLAGMCDTKVLKGVTRGWAGQRPSKIVEFIHQTQVPNPLFILDEIDKAHAGYSNGGDPQEALLDLTEPQNAKRFHDIYLMAECDLSHCLYIATANSLDTISEPLMSRLRPVHFPPPGEDHALVLISGVVKDLEKMWNLPEGAVTLTDEQRAILVGLSPREMRAAILDLLANEQTHKVH
jgi:hypothetical protein